MKDIECFYIRLEKENDIYYAGDSLKGCVEIIAKQRFKINNLKLLVKGKGEITWSVYAGETPIINHESEEYIKSEYMLLSDEDDLHLEPGTHSYPFDVVLPSNLPSSFSNDISKIHYELEAIIDKPWSLKKHVKKHLTVFSNLNLDTIPNLKHEHHVKDQKIFLTDYSNSHPINLDFKIDKTGFTPGEKMDFEVNIDNESDKEIKEMIVKIVQITRPIHGSLHEKKNICSIMYQDKIHESAKLNWNGSLLIPIVCPSTLNTANDIIDISYKAVLKISPSGISTSKRLEIPILIGTVPLSVDF